MRSWAILARALDAPRVAAIRAPIDAYGRAAGGLLARGLAFAALFAAIPSLLLILGIIGWIADDPTSRDRISSALTSTFPPLSGLIEESVQAVRDGAVLTSLAGILGLVWTVSQFYGALDLALARIFSGEPERSVVRRTVRGFATVLLLAVGVIGFVGLGSLATTIDLRSSSDNGLVQFTVAFLGSPVVPIAVGSLLVLLVYRVVPPRTPSWHAAVIPAAVVGAVIVILSRGFTLLVPRLIGVEALAGSLASAFVTLAWLSLTFQTLLLGAAWVRVRNDASRNAGLAASAVLERATAPAEPGAGGQ